MQHYIDQLIKDIHNAAWKVIPPAEEWEDVDLDNDAEVEDIAYLEQNYFGVEQAITEITGIEKNRLPEPTRLSDEQKGLLAPELENLLHHFNLYPDFPKNFPDYLKYDFIFYIWEDEHVPVSFGENHIKLCDFEEDTCPFPEYCQSCKEVRLELENAPKTESKKITGSLLPTKAKIERFMQRRKKEESGNDFDDLPIEENYILGIFNYCDRWCERCAFTARCEHYSITQEFNFDTETSDESDNNHLNELTQLFEAALNLFTDKAKEFGIDLNNPANDTFFAEKTEPNPLQELAENYTHNVGEWLENQVDFLNERVEILVAINETQSFKLADALEVIQWYHIFISAKLHRSLHLWDDDPEDSESIFDRDGSAKVALIAIDQSIAAFSFIMEFVPEMEDNCLKYLIQLSKIKTETEKQFPQARAFLRPGLDE